MIGVRVLCTEHVDRVVEVFDAGQLLQPGLHFADEEVLERHDARRVVVELKQRLAFFFHSNLSTKTFQCRKSLYN